MPGKHPVSPTRPLLQGRVLPPRPRLLTRLSRHRAQPAAAHTARLLVLVPAQDAEATIAATLRSLQAQTRVPDRVVVLADDCLDDTEQVARGFEGVTVMRTVENPDGRAGALTAGWRRFRTGADLVAVVDADTVLAPDCLEQLERTLAGRPGGVVARYGVDQELGSTPVARRLVRRDPAELADWTLGALRGERAEYALDGQVGLFDSAALHAVTARRDTPGPWDLLDGDPQLMRDLRRAGAPTSTAPSARVHAGPVLTVSALARRRRVRAERDALALRSGDTRRLRRARLALLVAAAARLGLLALLGVALVAGAPLWPWLVVAAVAAVAGGVRAWRLPHRAPADVVAGALVVPGEVDLWLRVGCTAAGWARALRVP
ncbi:glycosyltransferase family 2 protein [Klenkia brasiliensis]|uniref:Glycosyl transferase family 2 n=1 Tax=Klenkia brasiliensis TaxID=333142 RepID=A0A1G7QMD5_9ACTN|nr:glycosyltransferase family 2 protein [Klenkia brasiliensis]SDF99717.1 Glycosyl transferase family 2 [Klenkia brasiliensis]